MPKTALLVVDVQNDFCPGGSLAVPNGDEVVEPLNKMIERAVKEGWPVIASRDWHPEVTNHFQPYGGPWPTHCVQETEGALFHRDLRLTIDTVIVSKRTKKDEDAYSAFQGGAYRWGMGGGPLVSTPGQYGLHELLQARDVDTLYVGGLATDYCVKATVLDALRLGYKVYVLHHACRAVNLQPDDGRKAIAEMMEAGAVISFEPYESMFMRRGSDKKRPK